MHWRLSHWNSVSEQTGQSSSSLPSSHSAKPSQRHACGMQSTSPEAQVNCSGEQVGGSGTDRHRERAARTEAALTVGQQGEPEIGGMNGR